ncbi:F-box only protein 33-like [Gigantopelta aegis]|uniref:F-box only protein 33-like n=1 Tax=Gigantopelta aegis TaxID=1735272 RepID=UPI001B88E0F3|nr:F-box only protein 33-like [Gigantopelta aegis]
MAAGQNWAEVPSVLIVEILSYLSLKDRIKASSVCKRWRSCLFHPSLWKRIVFKLDSCDREGAKFLAGKCGRFISHAVVKFNSHNISEVRECGRLLEIFSKNKNLQYFSLQPLSCHLECSEADSVHVTDKYLDLIEALIKQSRQLRHFSLGCVEDLLVHSGTLIEALQRHHSSCLRSLHLASVKENSESYGIVDLSPAMFRSFTALQHLSLDYDHLSNELFDSLAHPASPGLVTLTVHVHGVDHDHGSGGVSNDAWRRIASHSNDTLRVTLNLVHSYDGVSALLDILRPSMPLAHFRQFFCAQVSLAAVTFLWSHHCDTLRTVHIVDGLVDSAPGVYSELSQDPDPFVMMAWRCPKLEHLTVIGYEVAEENIVAIARLRGDTLKTLDIPRCCISTVEEKADSAWVSLGVVSDDFHTMVSQSLKREWRTLEDYELPRAVFDDQADAEETYMATLLADQVCAC